MQGLYDSIHQSHRLTGELQDVPPRATFEGRSPSVLTLTGRHSLLIYSETFLCHQVPGGFMRVTLVIPAILLNGA